MKNLLLLAILTIPLTAKDAPPALAPAKAAEQFLASLDDARKSKAAMPFGDDERTKFKYTPGNRAGLPLKEMTEEQKTAAMALLDSALSDKGKLKVKQIMILESVLAEMENNPTYRDDGRYFVSIFGTPGNAKGWGWRFEGHHLSVSVTLVEGKDIAVTPSFMGSNPGEVRQGQHKGLRVLAEEEDLARTLITTLLAAGKKEAVFSETPPGEILSAENREVTALDPVGITAADMTDAQRKALLDLVSAYTGRYRSDIAAADMAQIEKAGIDKIRFGWAGGTKAGEAYYYRIQGPTFLMECANVQNEANHVHAAWRDFTGDFGRDILGEHFKEDAH
ncbi:MAG: DUF3500 domain-containing protein [Verrucomicrobiota bacterium]